MIAYVGGPEGGGKSAFATIMAREHHLLGGEVWAFPGYKLKNNRGRVVSRMILPHEINALMDEMQYVLWIIDEIQIFMNNHAWQNAIIDLLDYGLLAQRRKREFNLIATGPYFNVLPPQLQQMFHIVFHCGDNRWLDHSIPRGSRISIVATDMRGVLSGWPYSQRHGEFDPRSYYKYWESFTPTELTFLLQKIHFHKNEITVDAEGNVVQRTSPKMISNLIDEFLKAQGQPEEITKYELNNYIATRLDKEHLEHDEIITTGRLMGGRGYMNRQHRGLWKLPEGV